MIIFIIKGYKKLKHLIKKIVHIKLVKKENIKNKKKFKKIEHLNNIKKKNNFSKKNKNVKNPIKKKLKKNKNNFTLKINNNKSSFLNLKETQNNTKLETINKEEAYKSKFKTIKIMELNDKELNSLNYLEALKIDKRSYFQYYLSMIKQKQNIIFTFYTKNDYNSRSIKICLFFFGFAYYYIINALFFTDSTMHKIYEDKGKLDLIYQLPKIFYSSLISGVLGITFNLLSLTENDIIQLKNIQKDINNEKIKTLKNIKIKSTVFFILMILFLGFCWYYISCFCAIYRNTQVHLIKDTLISFTLSLVYPFVLNLLPGIFRINSLRAKKKDKKCLYRISQLIQLI